MAKRQQDSSMLLMAWTTLNCIFDAKVSVREDVAVGRKYRAVFAARAAQGILSCLLPRQLREGVLR